MQRPLAGLEGVRVARVEAEVRAAVLVMDPGVGIDDAGAEAHVVRLDQAHRIAGRVDHREVDSAAAAGQRGGRRSRGPGGVDPTGEVGGIALVEEPGDRNVPKLGVAQRAIAIRHCKLRRLDPQVDPAERVAGLELFEHVENLQRDEPGAVGRMGRDAHAAVGRLDRRSPGRAVAGEVAGIDRRAGHGQRARLALGQLALVERAEAILGESPEGRRERGQPNDLARPPGPAVRPVDGLEAAGVDMLLLEDRGGSLDRGDEAVPGREPFLGELDGRAEDRPTVQSAGPLVCITPRPNGTRHRDREPAAEGQPRQPSIPECRGIRRARRTSRAVERQLSSCRRIPDQPERVAAEAAAVRHDDGEYRIRRDRGIDRRTARGEDTEARCRREVMWRDDRTARAAGEGHGHQRRRSHRRIVGTTV